MTIPANLVVSPATKVAQLAGVPEQNTLHPNDTTQWGMHAADLGIMWDNGGGKVLVAFGDNYGQGWNAPVTSGPVAAPMNYTIDHRPNAIATSPSRDLSKGMVFDWMATDQPGSRGVLLTPDRDMVACIPTSGMHLGDLDFLTYMDVASWGPAGEWSTKRSGIATSSDGGWSWDRSPYGFQPNLLGQDPFQQCALAYHDGYVYRFGTPNGRFGSAYVSRLLPINPLAARNVGSYAKWNDSTWETQAVPSPIFPGPVGELSVWYNPGLELWLATYLNQGKGQIVLRYSLAPEGPWSDEQVLINNIGWETYGAFIHPWSGTNDLYFVVSEWGCYQTFLMHATLSSRGMGHTVPG